MSDIFDKAKDFFEAQREKAAPVLEQAKDRAEDVLEDVKEKVAPVLEQARDKAEDVFEDVKEKVAPVLEQAKDKAEDVLDRLTGVEPPLRVHNPLNDELEESAKKTKAGFEFKADEMQERLQKLMDSIDGRKDE